MPEDPGAYCRFSEGRIPQGGFIFGTTTPSMTIIRMNYKFKTFKYIIQPNIQTTFCLQKLLGQRTHSQLGG